MCGRYEMLVNPENKDMNYIIDNIETKITNSEIFPSDTAPVIANMENNIKPELFIWGFPSFKSSGLIINAKAETAAEKSLFKNSLLSRRCVIPSTGFFEWTKGKIKQKYKFNIPGQQNLYMAGIWNEYNGERRYVILTTSANKSVANIHNRMPVILTRQLIKKWIADDNEALSILEKTPPELSAYRIEAKSRQLNLFNNI